MTTRTTSVPYLDQNFQAFDFELAQDEMDRLAELDRGERTGPDPDTFAG